MIKHDAQYDEAMVRAEEDFRRADGLEMKTKCPYIFSSNMADVYWITANSLYIAGKKPRALHKSRGNDWMVDFPGYGIKKIEVRYPDHRNGLIGKYYNA